MVGCPQAIFSNISDYNKPYRFLHCFSLEKSVFLLFGLQKHKNFKESVPLLLFSCIIEILPYWQRFKPHLIICDYWRNSP